MRVLILGALGPYPERVRRFLEDGQAVWYLTTEPLPPEGDAAWQEVRRGLRGCERLVGGEDDLERVLAVIQRERIEVVYSLLNAWDNSNALTASLLRAGCPVPVVRHYKEHHCFAPFEDERVCLEESAGTILLNEESRAYFAEHYRLPPAGRTVCLDADPLPARYLEGGRRMEKLSAVDGRPRLLIAGTTTDEGGRYDSRAFIGEFTAAGGEVHLYGQFRRLLGPSGQMLATPEVEAAYRGLPAFGQGRLRLHAPIPPARFAREWSRFDAGLLHIPSADDPFRRLNLPNRFSAYLAAGLPVALPAGEMPAMERLLAPWGAGIAFRNAADLFARLPDPAAGERALVAGRALTFEAAIYPGLIAFLRRCAARAPGGTPVS